MAVEATTPFGTVHPRGSVEYKQARDAWAFAQAAAAAQATVPNSAEYVAEIAKLAAKAQG